MNQLDSTQIRDTPPARLDQDEELHWLALRMVPGLGTRRAWRLIQRFRSPMAVFRATPDEIEAAGIPPSTARSIASGCAFEDAVIQHQKMLDCGAVLVSIQDPRYPPSLRAIFDPPVTLFVRGQVELLARPSIGVVGTRRPTPYGVAVTERLSADLARAHLVIASGMARGIDTAAHRAVLDADGATVAVFGCGVDRVYPAENRKLADRIANAGLLVSEFPMGTPAHPQNFPIRNRIISGISLGVLVVEGAQYSGSSITAKMAMEQNREVFAVPGNITSKLSWGPNLLLKQGAKLVQEWTDVVDELPTQVRRSLTDWAKSSAGDLASDETLAQEQASLPLEPLGRVSRTVLEILQVDRPFQVDELLEKLEQFPSSEIFAALFELEMLGLIRQLPGKQFAKVW